MGVRTTFVIGAGASAGEPFFLSTARGLVDKVIKDKPAMFEPDPNAPKWSNEDGLKGAKAKAAAIARQIELADPPSLDRYLESHPEHVAYGKWVTARYLLRQEYAVAAAGKVAHGWYSWLLEHLLESSSKLFSGEVQFITFNYDRLLEMAIWTKLCYRLNTGSAAASKQLALVPIHHVYGRFAGSVTDILSQDTCPYYASSLRQIMDAAAGIKIMSDERPVGPDDALIRCVNAIRAADQVVFLGFGYDKTNLERIGATPKNLQGKELYGSAMHLMAGQVEKVKQLLDQPIQLAPADHDCLATLKHLVAHRLGD